MLLGSFMKLKSLRKLYFTIRNALKFARKKEACDPLLVAEAHASIALIRDNNSQTEQALFHFRKCLEIEEKENPESPEVEDT
jgi:hypothetical protein